MKTIANCNPIEFIQQTNKIRKSVSTYFDATKILEIRKNKDDNLTLEENAKKNINDMLDVALDKHPKETAEFLGLLCFVEPSEVENYKGIDFLMPALEIIQSETVLNFFTSLLRLGKMNISD